MTYDEVLGKIRLRLNFGIKPGLSRIKKILNLLGNPQDKLKFIHVCGTNGKGSVCKMLSTILTNSFYKTGLFISPYVLDFRERFQINDEMISESEFVNLFKEIEPYLKKLDSLDEYLTEFELITAMAFLWFYKKKCDIVVLEVGLGGRFDATNVISSSIVSVVNSISFDHMNILGENLEKIAFEKAGILKNNGKVVLYPQSAKSVEKVIKDEAKKKNCKVFEVDLDDIEILDEGIFGTKFLHKGKEYFLNLCGRHQIKNVSVVLKVLEVLDEFKIDYEKIKFPLKNIKFPARLDIVFKDPMIVVDGAHNLDGINNLKYNIMNLFKGKNIIGIAAMLRDKDVDSSLKSFLPLVSKLIVTEINNERSLKSFEIFDIAKIYCKDIFIEKNIKYALKKAHSLYKKDSVILVFGSLYLASEFYNAFYDKS